MGRVDGTNLAEIRLRIVGQGPNLLIFYKCESADAGHEDNRSPEEFTFSRKDRLLVIKCDTVGAVIK